MKAEFCCKRIGEVHLPETSSGSAWVPFKDAKPIAPFPRKFSYHPRGEYPSAIIQLSTGKEDPPLKYSVSDLAQIEIIRKIAVIVPANPLKFPVYGHEIGQSDLVIPIDGLGQRPFRVGVYLCKKGYNWGEVLPANPQRVAVAICENKDWQLMIELYWSVDNKWPRLTVFLPYQDGIEVA
ncbi:MAG: hypothetical protein HYZ95_00300 [Candidatus Omnitrophica bacterium]|nr:hypothetical protein [Candidatus Omnitrophota bacterium]